MKLPISRPPWQLC